jgi:hypothetical protein
VASEVMSWSPTMLHGKQAAVQEMSAVVST